MQPPPARRWLLKVADDYRGIAAAASRAVTTMRALRDLAPVPNDPSRRDPAAFVTWMEKKIELQRAFAQLLNDHAEESERVLAELRAG